MKQDSPQGISESAAPVSAHPAHSTLEPPPEHEFDALTDLFIGDAAFSPQAQMEEDPSPSILRLTAERDTADEWFDDQRGTPAASVESARMHVTALVLGHLPVFASAWANQYARHMAESTNEPVAVLRIRGGYASLDIVGSPAIRAEGADSLEDAIRRTAAMTSRWVLRVGEPDEPGLARSDAVDELTLLTGIDEAAVVASYQTLKRFGFEPDRGPEVTLAVMAADLERAEGVARKISRAAETFLERPARVVCCIEQISGGPSTHVFSGDSALTLEEALELIRSPRIEDPATRQNVDRTPVAVAIDRDPVIQQVDAESVAASVSKSSESIDGTQSSERWAEAIDSLELLEARCPYCESITLAIDEQGRLNLIADAKASPEIQIADLTTAGAWALDHVDLLALTDPRVSRNERTITRHLITRSPPAVRRLLDSEIRIHLLIETPGSARVLVPLNAS